MQGRIEVNENVAAMGLSYGPARRQIDVLANDRCTIEPWNTLFKWCLEENPNKRPTVLELIREKSPELREAVEKILKDTAFKMDFIECQDFVFRAGAILDQDGAEAEKAAKEYGLMKKSDKDKAQ